jgi:hypothetical protein
MNVKLSPYSYAESQPKAEGFESEVGDWALGSLTRDGPRELVLSRTASPETGARSPASWGLHLLYDERLICLRTGHTMTGGC